MAEPVKIAIVCDGGDIVDVYTAGVPVEFVTVDRDVEGIEEIRILPVGGVPSFVRRHRANESDPTLVLEAFGVAAALEKRDPAAHGLPTRSDRPHDGPYRRDLAEAFRDGARELQIDRLDIADDAPVEEGPDGGVFVHCRVFVADGERLPLPGEGDDE